MKILLALSLLLVSAQGTSTRGTAAAVGGAVGGFDDLVNVVIDLMTDAFPDAINVELESYQYTTETYYADAQATSEHTVRRFPTGDLYGYQVKLKSFGGSAATYDQMFWIGGIPDSDPRKWCPGELRKYYCDATQPGGQKFSWRKNGTLRLRVSHHYPGRTPRSLPPFVSGKVVFRDVVDLPLSCVDRLEYVHDYKSGFGVAPEGRCILTFGGWQNMAFEFGNISVEKL